jgi:hypothetical protein
VTSVASNANWGDITFQCSPVSTAEALYDWSTQRQLLKMPGIADSDWRLIVYNIYIVERSGNMIFSVSNATTAIDRY